MGVSARWEHLDNSANRDLNLFGCQLDRNGDVDACTSTRQDRDELKARHAGWRCDRKTTIP
jgi:hypothetical protein